jgi:hypothetical protein
MSVLRSASYGTLVGTAFGVFASFHVLLAFLLSLIAVVEPGVFHWGTQPAENAGQALGIVAALTVALWLLDVLFAAVGAGVWMLARSLLAGRSASK